MLKRNLNIICAAYLLLVTGAELLTAYGAKLGIALFVVGLGFLLHVLIMVGLLLYACLEYGTSKIFSLFLITLVLPPLIRILSFIMPIVHFSLIFWFILISIPIFIVVFTCMWLQGLHSKDVGLSMPTRRGAPVEAGVILLAIPFGILEYLILKPSPLSVGYGIPNFVVVALIIIICTGFLEEIAFRGLIQFNTLRVMSKWWGILFVATIFGVLHAGNLSLLDCMLAFSAGVVFSIVREKTGSIYGISFSHGVINIILFLVMPRYF